MPPKVPPQAPPPPPPPPRGEAASKAKPVSKTAASGGTKLAGDAVRRAPPAPPPPPGTGPVSRAASAAATSSPVLLPGPPGPPGGSPQEGRRGGLASLAGLRPSSSSKYAVQNTGAAKTTKPMPRSAEDEVAWMEDLGEAQESIKFAPVQIKDKLSLSVFIIHLIGMIVLFASNWNGSSSLSAMDDSSISMDTALRVFGSAAVAAAVFSGLLFLFMRRLAQHVVTIVFALGVVAMASIGGVAAAFGQWGWAILWFVIVGLFVLLFRLIRKRIKFAALIMEASVALVAKFPATLMIAYGAMLVQALWVLFWTLTWLVVIPKFGGNPLVLAALLLSLLWTSSVVHHIVHVTVAGTTGYWYFCNGRLPAHPTLLSLRRTIIVSLGSISLGSLITSSLKTFRMILQSMRRSNDGNPSFMVIFAGVCLAGLEFMTRFFNQYAYTYVAIYGLSFKKASQQTFDLLRSSGLDVIINDDIISGTLFMGSFLISSVTGFCGAFWAYSMGIERWFWGVGLPCALLGYVLGVVTLNTIESVALSLYVCFAEDPDALYYNDRWLYNNLTDAQELGIVGDIDSETTTEDEDSSFDEESSDEDEELMMSATVDFDDLTPEQLAEISSDDESNSERDPFMSIGVLKKRKRRKRFGIF